MSNTTATTTFASGITKAAPPARTSGRANTQWQAVADDLKANPADWFRVAEQVSHATTAHNIKNGLIKAFAIEPEVGTFDSRSHRTGEDAEGKPLFDIYAMFVPAEAETEDAEA